MDTPIHNEDYLNDNSKLDLKVMRALTRLQKKKKCSRKSTRKPTSSIRQIVKYLKTNYLALDGDLESQVKTALLQCIKNGLVCALSNKRYLLLGPKTKTMINNCISRTTHGEKCICEQKIGSTCCYLDVDLEEQGSEKKMKRKKDLSCASTEAESYECNAGGTCGCCLNTKQHKKRFAPSRKPAIFCGDSCGSGDHFYVDCDSPKKRKKCK